VPWLNVVLLNFRVEEFEIVVIAMLTVSLKAIAVYPFSPFAAKVCGVPLKKSRNLTF
jgi:hypothetical protein